VRLAGQTCLITGSTGIAEATATLAAREGADLFLLGNDEPSLSPLAQRTHARYALADVTSTAQVEAAVERCPGRIDALFHVVGISGRRFGDGPLHECTEEGWDVTLDTNLKGTFRVCRAVLRRMLSQETGSNGLRGTILLMASVLAFSPEPRHFATHAYAVSKAGIAGMTCALASYYAPHKIRVNALAPGLVRTPMSARAQHDPAILERLHTKQPIHQDLIEADDIARAAIFLLSGESRSTTGVVLPVDAGWTVS
jgi:NAD(P)-dependent dehydrogenase (short-subunit alcohol dehydrogenase family)